MMIDYLLREVESIVRNADEYKRTMIQLKEVLRKEYVESGGFMELSSEEAVFIGDVHGDYDTLKRILRDIPDRGLTIFLGDYIDRGPQQIEVLALVAKLKIERPDRVHLIRGNHEPPLKLIPFPHDYPDVLREAYGRKRGEELYSLSLEVFQYMPYAIKLGKVLALHGGLPTRHDEFVRNPPLSLLEEVLWNDPMEIEGESAPSPRGAGFLFGKKVTRRWSERLGFSKLIRGHEPCDGIRVNHDGMVITVFSRLGPPYYNSNAGIVIYERGICKFKLY